MPAFYVLLVLYPAIHRQQHIKAPFGKIEQFAHDRWAILLSRPTNMAFGVRDGDRKTMYVANLGRQTITRAKVDVRGQLLANQR